MGALPRAPVCFGKAAENGRERRSLAVGKGLAKQGLAEHLVALRPEMDAVLERLQVALAQPFRVPAGQKGVRVDDRIDMSGLGLLADPGVDRASRGGARVVEIALEAAPGRDRQCD